MMPASLSSALSSAAFAQHVVPPPRQLQTTDGQRGLIDLIELNDFDVQIQLTSSSSASSLSQIQTYQVTDVVTQWMNLSLQRQLQQFGYITNYAVFDTVYLLERTAATTGGGQRRLFTSSLFDMTSSDFEEVPARHLADTSAPQPAAAPTSWTGNVYTARYKGAALFTRSENHTLSVPVNDVRNMQTIALLDSAGLLQALQASSAKGLGDTVAAAQALVDTSSTDSNNNSSSTTNHQDLQIVIIVAIVVACVAFFFLVVAIYWAWRYDQRHRSAFLAANRQADDTASPKSPGDRPDRTGSDTTFDDDFGRWSTPDGKSPASPRSPGAAHPYPREILGAADANASLSNGTALGGVSASGDGFYGDSIISEDISTSLSQYYRSVDQIQAYHRHNNSNNIQLNDAASISSMESYGYSLDGYAPTIASAAPPGMTGTLTGVEDLSSLMKRVDDNDVAVADHEAGRDEEAHADEPQ